MFMVVFKSFKKWNDRGQHTKSGFNNRFGFTITLKVFIITMSQYDRMQIILSDEKLDN